MELPQRLGKGRGVRGPDHYGCCNTGLAPAIMKSQALCNDPKLSNGYKFVVGPELFVDDAIRAMYTGKVSGRTWRDHTRRYVVRFFKNYKAAKKAFQSLVDTITQENNETRDKHVALKKAASEGNPQAALDLLDY